MNVLFVSGIGGDTRRYRCLHHQEQLALHGIASTLREAEDVQLYVDATTCDLLVLHRVPWRPRVADIVAIVRGRGIPVLFETDDLVFAPELHDRIAFLDTLPAEAARRFRSDLLLQAETFAHCDCVLTTTQYLADAAVARGKPAYVQRNAFSAAMVAASEAAYTERQARLAGSAAQDRPFVAGYFSGTGSHNRDFAVVAPVLADLMAHHPQLWLHLSGHLEIGGRLLAFQHRIRRAPYVAWQELPHLIAQVDVNLAPLELDNPFCQAKSEIKYTEAALVGVPTVASPTEAFAFAIEDGRTGLLAATPEQWHAALAQLIEEPAAGLRIGEAARGAVYARYVPEVQANALMETLAVIDADYAQPPGEAGAALTSLAERMTHALQQSREETAQLGRQVEQLRQALAQWEGSRNGEDAGFWRQSLEENQARQAAALREILARLQRSDS
jgi:glycosyltransferase involved in cell wall biosynthesis